MSSSNMDLAAVLQAEKDRCDCLMRQDYAGLRDLLHPSLTHVHTRGNVDSRESYLRFISEVIEILKVERQDLSVKIFGECAIMSGIQINTARARGREETVTVKTQLLQVWLYSDRWRQVAFQATALGPLPPAPAAPTALG